MNKISVFLLDIDLGCYSLHGYSEYRTGISEIISDSSAIEMHGDILCSPTQTSTEFHYSPIQYYEID
jgi:hypothetical protein